MENVVTRELVPEARRSDHVGQLFGLHFPMQLEPFIYSITEQLSADYKGGYWLFYALSNGGFYMAPDSEKTFAVSCENYYQGTLSADALGIVACLYAFSHLSFSCNEQIGRMYARHYHLLREYMCEHPELAGILGAID
ncbi:MAG: antirestriction protein [Kiritimatiellia bacterium]